MSFLDDVRDFFSNLGDKLRIENEERRREDLEEEVNLEANLVTNTSEDTPKIVKVDFCAKENSLNHSTENYELVSRGKGTAIVRRGASFQIDLELNQIADLKRTHELIVFFNFGPRPILNKGTQAVLSVNGKRMFDREKDEWDHRVVKENGNNVTIEIFCPYDVPVGVWAPIFELKKRGEKDPSKRHLLRPNSVMYILFNPWCKDDDVYMKDDTDRNEYVLNDVGRIWIGGYPTAYGRQWVFGQFDDAVLPACIILLERAGISWEQRGDPIVVCRAISRIVNSNDSDRGALVGRWDEHYDDGTSPAEWSGSIKILEEYLRTQQPVKYGQCWVFSGVSTTICRALGIPSRSVTNLNSAHDTNKSLTIDKYYDKDGKEFESETGVYPAGLNDSIWNFHVWNEVWMARPDLPTGYGGWQAIDSTPQEASHGIYQCGPASIEAIRKGETSLNYDVDFVMAEVNADLVRWQRDPDEKGGFKRLTANREHIGRQLLTKKPGKMESSDLADRKDITNDYKPPERTNAERVTLHAAARRTRAARHAFRMNSVADEDIEFQLVDVERVMIGDDYTMTVKIKNNSKVRRTVSVYLYSNSEYYNGTRAHLIKQAEGQFVFEGGEEETLNLHVTYKDYFDKLVEHAMMKLVALASVKETTQTWCEEDTFQVLKPSIQVEVDEQAYVGKALRVKLSFDNPLDRDLKKCSLVIDGPGLTRPKKMILDDVEAKGKMEYQVMLYPKKSGSRSLICAFNSSQLVNITGSTNIDIFDP